MTSSSGDFDDLKGVLAKVSSTALPSLAGYRGFIVTTLLSDGTTVGQMFGKGGQSSTTLETTLLNSNGGTLSADVISIASAAINGQVSSHKIHEEAIIKRKRQEQMSNNTTLT